MFDNEPVPSAELTLFTLHESVGRSESRTHDHRDRGQKAKGACFDEFENEAPIGNTCMTPLDTLTLMIST